MRKYLLPILVGSIVSFFVLWAFESFRPMPQRFFVEAIGKSVAIIVVVVVLINMMNRRG